MSDRIEIVRDTRVIASNCVNCGQPWRDHGSGGCCPMWTQDGTFDELTTWLAARSPSRQEQP